MGPVLGRPSKKEAGESLRNPFPFIHVHSRLIHSGGWLEAVTAEVRRGAILEAVHHAAFAEADASGALLAFAGEPELVTTLRSSAKPLQALPLVMLPNADALVLSD